MSLIAPSVKVYEQGLISGTQNKGIWAGDAILDTLEATITIPAALAPGDYLVRHELLAVHQANNPQCPSHQSPHPMPLANPSQSTPNAHNSP
jgi:hypothetical protein